MRQDPDVILVGEIRDEETMDIALKAAETGHLVLSTLHTPDVTRTVGRVLSLCGSQDAQEIRDRFGDALKGIVAQRLLPRVDGGHVRGHRSPGQHPARLASPSSGPKATCRSRT